MKYLTSMIVLIGVLGLSLAGCHTAPPAPNNEDATHDRNEGYSLLYKLTGDLKDVDKALLLRTKEQDFKNLINAIADMAQHANDQLTAYNKADPRVIINPSPLPAIELEVRGAIRKSETVGLLTSKDSKFNRRLLCSQASGTQYAEHLAKVIQKHESNAERRQFLAALEKQAHDLHERVIAILAEPHAE